MSLRRIAITQLSVIALMVSGFVGFAVVPSNYAAAASTCSFYAAPSGSDANSGSASSPFATVGKLVGSLSPGQTGCLAGATFTGDVSIHRGGTADAPITITSTDPHSPATIKGRLATFSGADWITFTQLRLDGVNSNGLPSPTIGSEHVTFSHVDVTNDHTAICFDLVNSSQWGVARNTTIDSSRIHDCGRLPFGSTNNDHGIYISGFNTTVTNNYIYDNTDRGVQLRGSQGAVVQHNVIDGNGEGVIFGDLSADNNDVAYNIVANSVVRSNLESWWGTTSVGSGNSAHDNCVWATNANAGYNTNGGVNLSAGGYTASNNRTANPLYVDAAAGNFALASGTGCAGYGVEAGVTPGATGTSSATPTPTATSTLTATSTSTSTGRTSTTTAGTTTTSSTTTTSAVPSPTPTSNSPPGPPVSTAPPTITGDANVGSVVTASLGAWTNATEYTFTWLRCGASGDGCAPITDATGRTYALTYADKKARIRVTVIAQNAIASTAAGSTATDIVKK